MARGPRPPGPGANGKAAAARADRGVDRPLQRPAGYRSSAPDADLQGDIKECDAMVAEVDQENLLDVPGAAELLGQLEAAKKFVASGRYARRSVLDQSAFKDKVAHMVTHIISVTTAAKTRQQQQAQLAAAAQALRLTNNDASRPAPPPRKPTAAWTGRCSGRRASRSAPEIEYCEHELAGAAPWALALVPGGAERGGGRAEGRPKGDGEKEFRQAVRRQPHGLPR